MIKTNSQLDRHHETSHAYLRPPPPPGENHVEKRKCSIRDGTVVVFVLVQLLLRGDAYINLQRQGRYTLARNISSYLATLCLQILVYGANAVAARVLKHARSRALPVVDTAITRDGCQEQLNSFGVCVLVDCTKNMADEWLANACVASGTHYIARSYPYHASTKNKLYSIYIGTPRVI